MGETDPENTIFIDLEDGRITIELLPDIAPQHVERVKELTRKGFYDGIIWHRVIDGFMAQTGDPTGTGFSGSELPDVPAEFNETPFERGVIGMARSQSEDSANSQFFICLDDVTFLNGQYTVWAKVIDGMEHADNITKGEPPEEPDVIARMSVAADMQDEAVEPASDEDAA